MYLNKVILIGRLTRDPESRMLPSGQPVTSFGLATDRFFTDKTGQKQKQAEFHNVVAWGKQAEIVNQYLKKGSLIFVEGRIQTRNWQDPQGAKHYRTEVIAERVQLGPRLQGGGSTAPAQESAPRAETMKEDETPIIELPTEEDEIDVKEIPF